MTSGMRKRRFVSVLVFVFGLAVLFYSFEFTNKRQRFFSEVETVLQKSANENFGYSVIDSASQQRDNEKAGPQIDQETKDVDNFVQKMRKRMEERRFSVGETCQRFGLSSNPTGSIQLIEAKRYKLVYCPVAKTGCSNMKRVMLALNGYGNATDEIFPMKVVGQTNLLHKEIEEKFSLRSVGMPDYVRTQNYTKFIVVRHPIERAISAYKNKLTKQWNGEHPQFYKRSQQIREKFGKGARRNASGEDPTFEEFVDYISEANNTFLNGEDNHWNSVNVICYPCQNDFDVIATVETIEEDLRYLMMLIGAPESISMPRGYSKSGGSNTNEETLSRTLNLLPREKLDRLYQVYMSDFQMFGYSEP